MGRCKCRENMTRADCAVSRGVPTCDCECHGRDPAIGDEATLARLTRARRQGKRLSRKEAALALSAVYGEKETRRILKGAKQRVEGGWERGSAGVPEHVTDGGPCWCVPDVEHYKYGDVIIHREPKEMD